MEANTVTSDENRSEMQIGRGVYTTPNLGGWDEDYGWHCAVFADAQQFEYVDKAYVPRGLFQRSREDVTPAIWDYISRNFPGVNPAKTLLISYIEEGPRMQMLIPFDLLNANGGGLQITVECEDSEEKLRDKIKDEVGEGAEVDYGSWRSLSGEFSDVESDPGSEEDLRLANAE
ncbi:hypothetical protein CDD83_7016 [Cordyceps sp. RAO-2017]|nr:hypothetical protein CDD83_7016 [Cordyceps sp. RAO-2017]